MSEPCVCGHDEKDHFHQNGECVEVCCCAGYCTVLADSNLPWHHELVKAQARIEELEAAGTRLITELFQEIERLREALLGLPELEATFAKAYVRIVDLEMALAEARAALPKEKYVACPLCPHWMHLHEDGRCGSGCCPCNEPSAAIARTP